MSAKAPLPPADSSVATGSSTEHSKPAASTSSTEQPIQQNKAQTEQTPIEAIDDRARKAALAFASDISNNNPQVIERVNAAFEAPQRDPEVVGFYLDTDASDSDSAYPAIHRIVR